MPFDLVRLDDRVADALRERRSVRCLLHLRHDDGELIAAHARNDIKFARASTQSLADELQQLIADVMAKGIVNAFELIEIETENRQAFTALDAFDFVIELFKQQ